MFEPNIPDWVLNATDAVLPVFSRYFTSDRMSMGGGTILQARWNHRISMDIDLFVDAQHFQSVVGKSAEALESEIHQLPEINSSRSFVDANVVYCEFDGVEVTVLPSQLNSIEESGRFIPNSQVKTEATSTILYKKILGRMIGDGAFEIRDVYDIYLARKLDRSALQKAIGEIPKRSLHSIASVLAVLPDDWFEQSTKPLLGVADQPAENVLIEELVREFAKRL